MEIHRSDDFCTEQKQSKQSECHWRFSKVQTNTFYDQSEFQIIITFRGALNRTDTSIEGTS